MKSGRLPEHIAADRAAIERYKAEVRWLVRRVPPRVLAGSHQAAVAWKACAHKALKLAEQSRPSPLKLESAVRELRGYE